MKRLSLALFFFLSKFLLANDFGPYLKCNAAQFEPVFDFTFCDLSVGKCSLLRSATPKNDPEPSFSYELFEKVDSEVIFEDPKVVEYKLIGRNDRASFIRVSGKKAQIYDSNHKLLSKECALHPDDTQNIFQSTPEERLVIAITYNIQKLIHYYLGIPTLNLNTVIRPLGFTWETSLLHALVARSHSDPENYFRPILTKFIERQDLDLNFTGGVLPPLLFKTFGSLEVLGLLAQQKDRIDPLKPNADGVHFFQDLIKNKKWAPAIKVTETWPVTLKTVFTDLDAFVFWAARIFGEEPLSLEGKEKLPLFYELFQNMKNPNSVNAEGNTLLSQLMGSVFNSLNNAAIAYEMVKRRPDWNITKVDKNGDSIFTLAPYSAELLSLASPSLTSATIDETLPDFKNGVRNVWPGVQGDTFYRHLWDSGKNRFSKFTKKTGWAEEVVKLFTPQQGPLHYDNVNELLYFLEGTGQAVDLKTYNVSTQAEQNLYPLNGKLVNHWVDDTGKMLAFLIRNPNSDITKWFFFERNTATGALSLKDEAPLAYASRILGVSPRAAVLADKDYYYIRKFGNADTITFKKPFFYEGAFFFQDQVFLVGGQTYNYFLTKFNWETATWEKLVEGQFFNQNPKTPERIYFAARGGNFVQFYDLEKNAPGKLDCALIPKNYTAYINGIFPDSSSKGILLQTNWEYASGRAGSLLEMNEGGECKRLARFDSRGSSPINHSWIWGPVKSSKDGRWLFTYTSNDKEAPRQIILLDRTSRAMNALWVKSPVSDTKYNILQEGLNGTGSALWSWKDENSTEALTKKILSIHIP